MQLLHTEGILDLYACDPPLDPLHIPQVLSSDVVDIETPFGSNTHARTHTHTTQHFTKQLFMQCNSSETGFYTPPPVGYIISGPMGEGSLYTTGAEAENSAVKFSKGSVPPLYKNRSSKSSQPLLLKPPLFTPSTASIP